MVNIIIRQNSHVRYCKNITTKIDIIPSGSEVLIKDSSRFLLAGLRTGGVTSLGDTDGNWNDEGDTAGGTCCCSDPVTGRVEDGAP